MTMSGIIAVMLAGFAGSFHCVGMCGGFACGLGKDFSGSKSRTILRHVLYNVGRVVTYVFIGATAGVVGSVIVEHAAAMGSSHADAGHMGGQMVLAGGVGIAQRVLSVIAGALMLIMALQLMGLRYFRLAGLSGSGWNFASAIRPVMASRNPAAPVALGVMNGFLPCPLVYAFVALAAATGSPVSGSIVMLAFGLGTFPAMFFMGLVGTGMSLATRQTGVKLAACFVLLFGIFTVMRGVAPSLLHMGWHAV